MGSVGVAGGSGYVIVKEHFRSRPGEGPRRRPKKKKRKRRGTVGL